MTTLEFKLNHILILVYYGSVIIFTKRVYIPTNTLTKIDFGPTAESFKRAEAMVTCAYSKRKPIKLVIQLTLALGSKIL